MTSSGYISGVLVVNKPAGPSSHDIVLKVRRLLKTRVGHTGTLDPQASGVLVLTLGQATRLTRFLQKTDKVYVANLQLGTVTTSYDLEGEIVGRFPVPPISPQKARRTLEQFQGTITQLAPMFSAVKVKGEPLYKAARRKEVRERPPREIVIYSIRLIGQEEHVWKLRVHCSSGTYIRALAHELGVRLGCGACLSKLLRIRSGDFQLTKSVDLGTSGTDLTGSIIPMEKLLPHFTRIDLDSEEAAKIRNGRAIEVGIDKAPGEYCRIFAGGNLLAIGEIRGSHVHPQIVFTGQV